MYWQKHHYTNNIAVYAVAGFGRWRASDIVGEIKDKVHILPSLCFYFNSSEFYISFAWLTFNSWFLYTDFEKKRIY